MRRASVAILSAVSAAMPACAPGDAEDSSAAAAGVPGAEVVSNDGICRVVESGRRLPKEVYETSGLARSARDPKRFWTHNDAGNGAELFALGADGRLLQRVTVTGATAEDWEDVDIGRCDAGWCLYIGDIGDNGGDRERVTIYRVPEPAAGVSITEPAEALHARFPDRPQDAEALFVLPSGDLYIITKGVRDDAITLYRFPSPQRAGETATLERVRELFPEPEDRGDRVTAASATTDGRWVGIRTYRSLYIFPASPLVAGDDVEATVVDLRPLREAKGEGLLLADDGVAWLTSEAGDSGGSPSLARLDCDLSRR